MALVITACGMASPTSTTPSAQGQAPTGELVESDQPRSAADVDRAAVDAVVAGDRALGVDILQAVAGDTNLMISPYSIATTLSMTYPGARGGTADEIASVMHLTVDPETLHRVRNHIDLTIQSPVAPPTSEDERLGFTVRPANSLWGQIGYPFLQEYLDVLAAYYGNGMRALDFANDPAGSVEAINAWVEEATEQRIVDLIPPDAVDTLTRMVLVNAIWFKANWALQFSPELTTEDPFTRLDGSEVQVPMMHSDFKTEYAESERWQFVRLAYAGDAAMIVALPKAGDRPPSAGLTSDDWDLTWEVRQIDLSLPRFEFDSDVPLKNTLIALGMETIFDPPTSDSGADLTGITEERVLYVGDVFHQSLVAVDEHGTEAAAATAEIFEEVSAEVSPPVFAADRPFLFWIEDTRTGEPLFLGQVTDPLAG